MIYFLEKKDIMLPCPLGAAFLGFGADWAAVTFGFLATGSSSENDSQPGSSRVTVRHVSVRPSRSTRKETYRDNLPHPEQSFSS